MTDPEKTRHNSESPLNTEQIKAMMQQRFNRNVAKLKELDSEGLMRVLSRAEKNTEFVFGIEDDTIMPNLVIKGDRPYLLYPAGRCKTYCRSEVLRQLESRRAMQVYYAEEKEKSGQIHFRYINEMLRSMREELPASVTPRQSNGSPVAAVIGTGLGYMTELLCSEIEIDTLLIYEQNCTLFTASLYICDWAGLAEKFAAEKRYIKFFIGLTAEEFRKALFEFYTDGHNVLADYCWYLQHDNSAGNNAAAKVYSSFFNSLNSSAGFFDSRMFALSQSLRNLKEGRSFVREDASLPEEIRELPLFVVANGPSLSADLKTLRKLQNKALILACGTALETLYREGIRPHFYAAVERLKQIADVISLIPDRNFTRQLILLAPDVIHPETAALFDRTALFRKSKEPFNDLAAIRAPAETAKIKEAYLINPLVGNMGLSAACLLGFRHIFLFGADNGSARDDGRLHPEESVIYSKIFADNTVNTAESDKKVGDMNITVKGNFREKVYTGGFYITSAQNMMLMILQSSKEFGTEFYNCSDGVMLQGALPLHSDRLPEIFEELPEIKCEDIIKAFDEHVLFRPQISTKIFNRKEDIKLFRELMGTIRQILGFDEDDRLKCTDRSDIMHRIMYCQKKIKELLKTDAEPFVRFLDGSLSNFFTLTMRAMYLSSGEPAASIRGRQFLRLTNCFLKDAEKLFDKLPQYCEHEHREILQGRIGFDHEISKAPVLQPYISPVSEEDIKNYPVQIFKERYE